MQCDEEDISNALRLWKWLSMKPGGEAKAGRKLLHAIEGDVSLWFIKQLMSQSAKQKRSLKPKRGSCLTTVPFVGRIS
jgi:hypothetical protein